MTLGVLDVDHLYSRTAAQFTNLNPIVPKNLFFLEQDTGKVKRGDGMTAWTSLAYWDPETGDDGVTTAAAIATTAATLRGRDTATTAQLASLAATINTTDKYAGKIVFNTTANTLVSAISSAASGHWYSAAGADTHTPI